MRRLDGVTLLCADTRAPALALRAVAKSMEAIGFARALLLTDASARLDLPAGVERIDIAPIATRDAYSQLMLKGLAPFVATAHALVVQWDGYVVNADAWTDAFLACDYIGAPWSWQPPGFRVGNGGFSLRSRRLLDALADERVRLDGNEDETIGIAFRPWLEVERGIRFADEPLAHRFSFEAAHPIGRPFGFHGLFNFARVVPDAELAALARDFDDEVARSPQCLALMRNAEALGRWSAVEAIAGRIAAADPAREEARSALARARDALARGAGVGRNDPCLCGSGKRYKACHGALASTEAPAATADDLVREGIAAHARGEVDVARRAYDAALLHAPGHAHASHYLGVLALQAGSTGAAVRALEAAARARPDEPDFHGNLGLAYAAVDRHDDAIAAQRRALALAPAHAGAWNNLGLALQESGRRDEAVGAYDEALRVDPQLARARWNRGMARLARGDRGGWQDYEARLAIGELGGRHASPDAPRWDGGATSDKTILLDGEQGFGDTIQGLRYASVLAARGARVIVRVHPALAHLAAGAPGVSAVVAPDAMPACDVWAPMLSLPGLLGTHPQGDDAPRPPYLHADAARVDALRARVVATRPRLAIGLAWAGNPRHANDRRRSCPLAAFAPLLAREDCVFHSLQHVDGEDQIAAMPAARALAQPPERGDFDGKAALIAALDLVVSVDTSVAHLAGALGAPVLVLLPRVPDWRWGEAGVSSGWYPSAHLVRQARAGDWDGVVRAAGAAIDAKARAR